MGSCLELEREAWVRVRGVIVVVVGSLKGRGCAVVGSLACWLARLAPLVLVEPRGTAQGLEESRVSLASDFLFRPHLQEVESKLYVSVLEGALSALGSRVAEDIGPEYAGCLGFEAFADPSDFLHEARFYVLVKK